MPLNVSNNYTGTTSMNKDYFWGLSEEGFHRVAFTEWGRAINSSIPIICVHGLTRNGRDFDALAQFLAERGKHVFCPDIVGRGDSDRLRIPLHYTYEQYMLDMNTMIARTGATSIDWIGTSMGGLIGMILAAQPNSPIRRLILNDVGPQIPVKGLQRLARYVGREPTFSSLDEATLYFKTIYSEIGDLPESEWRKLAETSVNEVAPGHFVSKLDKGVLLSQAKSKIAWRALLHPQKALEGTFFDIDLWHIWRKITCPVLVVHGKQSDLLLPEIVAKMRDIHADTEVLEIPDAGHAPALFRAAEHEFIYEWLARHPG